jgi:hypothetical protein
MEAVGVHGLEGQQHLHDRIPGVVAPGHDAVGANVTRARFSLARSPASSPSSVMYGITVDRFEHARVLRQPGNHHIGSHRREFLCRDIGASLEQHLQPGAEPGGVELLLHPGARGLPEVQIEDARQLFGRRQRHEFRGVFQPHLLDDAMQELRLQACHGSSQVRRVEDALQEHGRPTLAPAAAPQQSVSRLTCVVQ